MPNNLHPYILDTPATYSIVVFGSLDPGLCERLGGLRMIQVQSAGDVEVTMLVGRLLDQAALFGVLNSLHYMAVPILAVQRLAYEAVDLSSAEG